MWEKYEKFWILGILALVVYYFYKKGMPSTAAGTPASTTPANFSDFLSDFGGGSVVNTASEAGAINPANSSLPLVFNPAQPSTVPVSQRVSAGQFNYMQASPVLRNTLQFSSARPTYLA